MGTPKRLPCSSELIGQLGEYERKHSRDDDHYHSVSVSPTLFEAGDYQNVIPARAMFTCDVRIPIQSKCTSVERDLGKVITAFAAAKGVGVKYNFEESTDPYEIPMSSLLVRAFQRSVLLRIGSRPLLLKKTGTGDMNTFALAKQAECVTYGPGEANLSHTKNESVRIDDYLQSIEVLEEALAQLKLLSGPEPTSSGGSEV